MTGTIQISIGDKSIVFPNNKPTVKHWRFAEAQWYCSDCGIVSQTDVQTLEADGETGICRCGAEIAKTTF